MIETVEGEYVTDLPDKLRNKIEVKYFVGQEVFIIYNNRAVRKPITGLRIEMNENERRIAYFFRLPGNEPGMPFGAVQEDVFETKNALYNAIMDL